MNELKQKRDENSIRECIVCNQKIKDVNTHYICLPNHWYTLTIIPINNIIDNDDDDIIIDDVEVVLHY